MGTKRGKEEGSFARETRAQAVEFYRDIVQGLRAWQPPAPKLATPPEPGPAEASPDPPGFADEEARDPGEGQDPDQEPPS